LTFTPVANATGTATITVTVNDGAASNNTTQQSFTVVVNSPAPVTTPPVTTAPPPVTTAANQPPTLNALANLTLTKNAGLQTVNFNGVTSGATTENQTLTVTAVSSNPLLIPSPTVNYASANAAGTMTFTPVANATGTATITVTVNDGAASNNTTQQSFTVVVNSPAPVTTTPPPITATANQPPTLNALANLTLAKNAGLQTVNLNGITSGATTENQTLTVTAVSSNPALVRTPTVNYTSPRRLGSLTFTPVANATGTATITVTVNDGAASNNTTQQSFTVAVSVTGKTVSLQSLGAADLTPQPSAVATLTPATHADGQFALTVSGVDTSGSQYIVQASTNLIDWIPVQTNTAPFTFVDVNTSQFSQRFYRAVSVSVP
jgi:hypothetical protein